MCVLVSVCGTLVTVMCVTVDLLTSLNSFLGVSWLKKATVTNWLLLLNTHTHHLLYTHCLIYGRASCVNSHNSNRCIIYIFSAFFSENLSTQTIWNTSTIVSWPDWLLCWSLICYGGSLGNVAIILAPHGQGRLIWSAIVSLFVTQEKWIPKVHFFFLLRLWLHSK